MDLDSAALRAFTTLAQEMHFARAAATLGVTQQALSKRIARLEAQLGAALVDRSDRRRLRLTPAGEELLPLAGEALAAVDRIGARFTPPAERLRVDILGDYAAPGAWVRRAARGEGWPVDVVERPAGAAADHLLLTGEADLAFGRAGAVPRPWPADLRHRLLLLEPLAVLAPAGHPWAAREHVRAGELGEHPLWFPLAAAPGEWRAFLAAFAEDFGLTIDTVGSTFGYTQWLADLASGEVPPSLVGEAMAPPDARLRVVPILDPTPVFPWSLLWREPMPEETAQAFCAALGFPREATVPDGVWLPAADAQALSG